MTRTRTRAPGGGRKPRTSEAARAIAVRLDPAELAAIDRAAHAALVSRSEWMRTQLVAALGGS